MCFACSPACCTLTLLCPLVFKALATELWSRCFAVGDPFRCIVIRGARGVGKTRLVREIATQARVYFGNCGEEECLPYAPFREAFGQVPALWSRP